MGFLTTIGTHRSYPKHAASDVQQINSLGMVRRVFRKTTYQPDSYLAGLRHLTRSKFDPQLVNEQGFWKNCRKRLSDYQHFRRRERFVRQFAFDCEKFFRNTLFTSADHAFFTAVSELELMGLAIYLASQPRTIHTQWHLQFHYNLFEGRPPEYDQQSSVGRSVRSCFLAALSRLSYHAVNFYTTSIELAEQYNRLGVGKFEALPYPIANEFAPYSNFRSQTRIATRTIAGSLIEDAESSVGQTRIDDGFPPPTLQSCQRENQDKEFSDDAFLQNQPIKFTCPGGIRREKGQLEYLQPLVDDIWEPLLSNGKVQLVLQRPKRKSLQKEKIELQFPQTAEHEAEHAPVVYLPHPLDRQKYVELIRTTDVGIMFYDSNVYYSRRAGILGELLASGKPVIVPAGSWLAEQIQEPILEHADKVFSGREIRRINISDFRWESRNVPMPGGILSFDNQNHPFNFEIDIEHSESVLGFTYDWHWPGEPGVYCRIELTQFDHEGLQIEQACQVVGHRARKKAIALFNIDRETVSVKFALKNAFHDSTASIKNVEIVTAGSDLAEILGKIPIGAVGVVAADREHLSSCILEVVEHLEHYRQTAQAFSNQWYARHEPKRTVAQLMAAGYTAAKVA